jgi:flagellar FliL protein
MSADTATHSAAVPAGAAAPAAKKKGGKKKLILMVAPLVLLMVIAGLWFSGILPSLLGHGSAAGKTAEEVKAEAKTEADNKGKADANGESKGKGDAKATAEAPTFVDMPEIIANLNGNPRHPTFVKLHAKLELAKAADAAPVTAAMPRLMDLFQTYLREMRPEEFRGSAGTYRLREELIARANIVAAPAQVQDVLFVELIVQ